MSVNFTVDTLAGTVYLVGTAQDQAERRRLVAIARGTAYVREVVDLIRLKAPSGQLARYTNLQ